MANAISAGGSGSLVLFNSIGDSAASLKPGEVVTANVTAVGDDGTVTVNLKGVLVTARSEVSLLPGMQALFKVASLGADDLALRFLGYQDAEASQTEQPPPSDPQPDQLPDFSSTTLGDTVSAQVSGTTPDGGTILKFPDGFLTVNSDVPLAKGETVLFKLVPSPRPGEIDLEFAGYAPAGGNSLPLQESGAPGLFSGLGDTVMRALAAVAAGSLTQESKGLVKDARAELSGLLARFTAQNGGVPQQIGTLIRLATEVGVSPKLLDELGELLVDMEKMTPGDLRQALEKSGVLLENRLRGVLDEGLRQDVDAMPQQGESLLRSAGKEGMEPEIPEKLQAAPEGLRQGGEKNGALPEEGAGLPKEGVRQDTVPTVPQQGREGGKPPEDFKAQLQTAPGDIPSSRGAAGGAASPKQEGQDETVDGQTELPVLPGLAEQKGDLPQQIVGLARLVSMGGMDAKLVEKLRDLLVQVEKMPPAAPQVMNSSSPQQKNASGDPPVDDFKARISQLQAELEETFPSGSVDKAAGSPAQETKKGSPDSTDDAQGELVGLSDRLAAQKGGLPQQIENLVRLASRPGVEPETVEKLRDLLADMEKMNPEVLRQALEKNGIPAEGRLRNLADEVLQQHADVLPQGKGGGLPLVEDFKARLLQVMKELQDIPPSSRTPAAEKALDTAQGMVREVEQYQSLSRISGTFASFLPLIWQGLSGGDAEFRRRGGDGEDAASSCRLNLELEEHGRLSIMVMFVKRGFSLYFRADEPRFRELLSFRTEELRGLFAKSGLFLRSVDVVDGENAVIEQLEASMEPVERAMSLTV